MISVAFAGANAFHLSVCSTTLFVSPTTTTEMPIHRARRLPAIALALCLIAPSLTGQSLRESVTDSALVDFASIAAFKIIAGYVAQAGQGARHAWIITVPAGLARWDSLARHL